MHLWQLHSKVFGMLSYNEITPKKIIIMNGEPYEVLSSHVFRKQQRKPVNQTKLRSLKTGSMLENTFHQNESAEEAEVETRPIKFIYSRGGEWWFCPPDKPRERFAVAEAVVGPQGKFLKENEEMDSLWFDDEMIQVRIPIKVELEVVEAPPNVKGSTAQGGVKPVVVETGATITAPMFIEVGDTIRVNTETGEYAERVQLHNEDTRLY